jgi:hypothetical protein
VAEAILPLAVLGLFAAVAVGVALHQARVRRRWEALGVALGLRAEQPPERLGPFTVGHTTWRGAPAGREVRLRTYATRSGKSSQQWTLLEVAAPLASPGLDVEVTREGLGSRLARVLGQVEVETGNAAFDEAHWVRARNAGLARAALGFAAQQAIEALPRFSKLRVAPATPRGIIPGDAPWVRALAARLQEDDLAPGGCVVALLLVGTVADPERVGPALGHLARVAEAAEAGAPA